MQSVRKHDTERPSTSEPESMKEQARALPGARLRPAPNALRPMQPEAATEAFSDAGWLFEPKFDGVRAMAVLHQGQVKLLSRQGGEMSSQYPRIVGELAALPFDTLILDGELVAFDPAGHQSFQA